MGLRSKLAAYVLLSLVASSWSCGGGKGTNSVRDVIAALEGRTEYVLLERGGVTGVVSPQLGAKLVGLSAAGKEGRNLVWFNPAAFADSFWQGGPRWNIGGLRSWIAPEAAFFLDPGGSWFVPQGLDPGNYQVVYRRKTLVECRNEFEVRDREGHRYRLALTRRLTLIDVPPEEAYAPITCEFAGVKLEHTLKNLGDAPIGRETGLVGLWSLLQVNTPGTMIIRLRGRHRGAYRDYFNPLGEERMSVLPGVITVKMDGCYRSKLGIRPRAAAGVLGYLWKPETGKPVLLVMRFPVNPRGRYVDHPWNLKGTYGDAVQVYNDDGANGGFAEMECHGPARELGPGESESHELELLVFSGREDDLKSIGSRLMRIPVDRVTLYY